MLGIADDCLLKLLLIFRTFSWLLCAQGVKELSDDEENDIIAYKFDERAERAELGIKGWHGEESYETLERRCLCVLVCIVTCV
jgi:hypothetical protein